MITKTFGATGAEQTFTAPIGGTYTFELAGAAGGKGNAYNVSYGSIPGKGAKLTFSVTLAKGDILHICVGKQGTGTTGTAKDGASGGGGGGTFIFVEIPAVVDARWDITKSGKILRVLAVAAGGGGTWDEAYNGSRGDGKNAIGEAYKSPSNYVAYSTTTNAGTASASVSPVMGVSQYIAYDLKGSFYTRSGSTGTGGYGGGASQDDTYTFGGGWYGTNNLTYSWCYVTTAVGVDGTCSGDGYCVITLPALALITDRTLKDVVDKTEKGFYCATDVNRVGLDLQYLAELLNGFGYAVTVTPETNWAVGDIPQATQMSTYLTNLNALKTAYYSGAALPSSMSEINYTDANNIETMLVNIESKISRMILSWYYCGEIGCGET